MLTSQRRPLDLRKELVFSVDRRRRETAKSSPNPWRYEEPRGRGSPANNDPPLRPRAPRGLPGRSVDPGSLASLALRLLPSLAGPSPHAAVPAWYKA